MWRIRYPIHNWNVGLREELELEMEILGTPGPSMMAEVMGVGEVPGGVKTGCPYVCKYSLMMACYIYIPLSLIPIFYQN